MRSPLQRQPIKKARKDDPFRPKGYTRFVRKYRCVCCAQTGNYSADKRHAHHLRKGIPIEDMGGTGLKPHDRWCLPLCPIHHNQAHNTGHDTFWARYRLNPVVQAESLFKTWTTTTPAGQKWRRENQ